MITIVDYGMGNLGSIVNMFKRIGITTQVSASKDVIEKSTKLLLPGVGAFDSAMNSINNSGLRDVLDYKALEDKIPVLGICLGMQLLTSGSEEGKLPGLNWIPAITRKFPQNGTLKIPHMGWNAVQPCIGSKLTKYLEDEARFYFVHSYYVTVEDEKDSVYKATHGIEFDAAINHKNIYGVQFHPEKSHKFGMRLLSNFGEL